MIDKYGTKLWAKWASQNLEFSLSLLKEPSQKWDEQTTYLEAAIKSLNIISIELKEILNLGGKK